MAVVDISNTYQLTNVGAHIDNTDVYNSNRNLLDNPWWGSGEVVNQRSFTSGQTTNNAYCIDRWKTSYGSTVGTISLGADGLTITAASGTYALINQVIERYSALSGKTVTASALLSNGTIVSGTVANLNWANNPIVVTSGNVRLQLLSGGYFRVTILNGGSATIRAVKLEIGSYSTLANDVPPDYDSEKRKCMAYFRRITVQDNGFIALGWATSATAAQFPNILGTSPMRAKPTATPTGTVYVRDPSGTDHAVSSFTVQYDPVTVCLQANTSGLTANTVARLRIGAGGRIDLSADL